MSFVHDVWEPLKQALLASRDVIIASQICVSKLQRFFTLGDGCWLPILGAPIFSPEITKYCKGFGLSVPDVSRERRCLQTSPEQLLATKDKKRQKIRISVPGRLGSFSGGGTKIQRLQKHRYSTSRKFAFGRTKIPGHEFRTIIRIFGIYVLRMLVA